MHLDEAVGWDATPLMQRIDILSDDRCIAFRDYLCKSLVASVRPGVDEFRLLVRA